MPASLSMDEILKQLANAGKAFSTYCGSVPESQFYKAAHEKWSVAQHILHLTISTRATRPAFSLPKLIVRLYTGKPNRPSRTYDELVEKYKLKLSQGGRASGRFIPPAVSPNTKPADMISDFKQAMTQLESSIWKNWNDEQLDHYLAPHPLLGKITLRELGYFTIYHTQHHLFIIREMTAPANNPG